MSQYRNSRARIRFGLCVVFAALTYLPATRTEAQQFQHRTYASPKGGQIAYGLFVPPNYNPAQKYPLLLFLHNARQRGSDGKQQLEDLAAVTSPAAQAAHPCFVLAPQCPEHYEVFQIYGYDRTLNCDAFSDYNDRIKDWKHYRIRVGQYYTGPRKWLFFWNFDWGSNKPIESTFRNVKVYEAAQANKAHAINFSQHTLEPFEKGGKGGKVTIEDDGATLHLVGEAMRRISLPYTITTSTVLEFDYKSLVEANEQGIGFTFGDARDEGRWVDVASNAESHVQPTEPSMPMRLTMELLPNVMKEFAAIDPGRIYAVGTEMGGLGVWDLITRRPNDFAAALPIRSAADLATLDRVRWMPIWCFHNVEDYDVRTDRERAVVAALADLGAEPLCTEYPAHTENLCKTVLSRADVMDWLFSQHIDRSTPETPAPVTLTLKGGHSAEISWPARPDSQLPPLMYRIYKDGNLRTTTYSNSYTDNSLDESDAASYAISAVSSWGVESAPSPLAWARTPPDTSPPRLLSAAAIGAPTVVELTFDKPLDPVTAQEISNFEITPDIKLNKAELLSDHRTVRLQTSGLAAKVDYTIKVSNLSDKAAHKNIIALGTSAHFEYDAYLQACLRFDEGEGLETYDTSGHEITGGLQDVSWARGRYGSCLEFDGVWGHNVRFRPTSKLDVGDALTISCWVRKTGGLFGRMGVLAKQSVSTHINQYVLDFDETQQIRATLDTVGKHGVTVIGRRIDVLAWHHIAITYSHDTLELWVDGVSQGTAKGQGDILNTPEPLEIGSSQQGQYPFKGDIDEVRIYNRALSADDIRALAQ